MKRKIPWRKLLIGDFTWRRLVRSVLFIYGALVAFAFFFSERLIFPAGESSYGRNAKGVLALTAADGTALAARFWEAPDAGLLILYFHGNAEDVGDLGDIADELVARGFSVLAPDYRGYGASEGKAGEENCYADAEVVYAEALRRGFTGERIILWGRSVGGGIATELAVRKHTRALVLESPFLSAFRAATGIPVFPFDKFRNLAKMDRVEEPLFILHGDHDEEIPAWQSEKLYQKHKGPKERYLIKGAGHQDVWGHDIGAELDAFEAFVGKSGRSGNAEAG